MTPDHVFTVVYWGTTGSLTAPLKSAEVTEKLVQAIRHLRQSGALPMLAEAGTSDATVRQLIEQHVPFCVRSTYGGNTTCIEIQTQDALFVLDAGSGFRELGIELNRRWNSPGFQGERTAHVLLTHAHMDHTFATPFVDPYYDGRNNFTMWGSQGVLNSLRAVLDPSSSLSQTYFPPTFEVMSGIRSLREVTQGSDFQIGKTKISTYGLRHPGGCLAFRLEQAGRILVFASDHEHAEVPDQGLAEFARGADLLYTEGQYLQDEYDGRVGIMGDHPVSRHGWGHSSVEACITTAASAGVRRLHLGHRDPKRSDQDLDRIEQYARQLMSKTLADLGRSSTQCEVSVAYEGLSVDL